MKFRSAKSLRNFFFNDFSIRKSERKMSKDFRIEKSIRKKFCKDFAVQKTLENRFGKDFAVSSVRILRSENP